MGHVELVMEEDEQPSLGPIIYGGNTYEKVGNIGVVPSDNISFQAYIDGAYNTIRLPLHIGGSEANIPSQISRVD